MASSPRLWMRQVHLDCHMPGEIPDVGRDFDVERFAVTVWSAAVNSMTVFSRRGAALPSIPPAAARGAAACDDPGLDKRSMI